MRMNRIVFAFLGMIEVMVGNDVIKNSLHKPLEPTQLEHSPKNSQKQAVHTPFHKPVRVNRFLNRPDNSFIFIFSFFKRSR